MTSVFHKMSQQRPPESQQENPEISQPKSVFHRMAEVKKDRSEVPEQLGKSIIEGVGGTYGNIADLLHLQTKERMLPGQKIRAEREFNASPEELINLAGESDVLPDYARLPSSEEVRVMTGRPEPQTASGRFAARGGGAIGSALAMGGGLGATATSVAGSQAGQAARELGAPEGVATGIDIGTSLLAGTAPTLLKKGTAITKPSGMLQRRFESLKKETKITPEIKAKITNVVSEDLKTAADKIMEGNKTFRGMREFPDFEEKLSSALNKGKELAAKSPEKFSSQLIKSHFPEIKKLPSKGYAPSEYEKAYDHYLSKEMKRIPEGEFSTTQLLEQYRKNNASLKEIFNLSKTKGINRAKRDAILDHNKAISQAFEEKMPESEFNSLFKTTNKAFADMRNIQEVDTFLDKLTENGLNFKEAEKYYKSDKIADAITRTFGKEAEEQFSGLMKDFIPRKDAMKLLKEAKASGIDLKDVVRYTISPYLEVGAAAIKGGKVLYQHSLSNPKVLRDWRRGIELLKEGSYAKGADLLRNLDKEED